MTQQVDTDQVTDDEVADLIYLFTAAGPPPWVGNTNDGGPGPCAAYDPETFFPLTYGLQCAKQIEEARSVCRACPLRDECLSWALPQADLDGIWGGTTPPERRRIRTGKANRPWRNR